MGASLAAHSHSLGHRDEFQNCIQAEINMNICDVLTAAQISVPNQGITKTPI